jgi:hypothetical protein
MAVRSKGEATGPLNGPGRLAWADRPGPASAQFLASFVCRRFPSLLDPSPFCMWALVVSFSSSWTKLLVSQDSTLFWLGPRSLSSSRVRSLGFLKSSVLHCMTCTGLQGLVEVLDELIHEVLLSTLKPHINTKLQNRHARMNLLYQGGLYQWVRYKTHANTEGKLMARLTEFHHQQL